MFVVAYTPSDDEVIYCRRLGPNEKMDLDAMAAKIADEIFSADLAPSTGYIPNCCGDFRVEFRPRKNDGVIIWQGQSYYLQQE